MTALRVDRPEHVERLWREGERLTEATMPGWLDRDTIGLYRRATAAVPVGEERDRLEGIGKLEQEGVRLGREARQQVERIPPKRERHDAHGGGS